MNEDYFVRHNFLKRAFDLSFSSLVILLGAPIFILIAVAVKCTSKGPIFYSSLRVGRAGETIHCWKFRTMFKDAEVKLKQLLNEQPALKEEWDKYFKLKNDPRVTALGKFLRKSSLDELPQFWNVMKGDLSIVGPRPVTPQEVSTYLKDKAPKILSVRPGITGLWQTSGRSLLCWQRRLLLEESYVEKQSFLFDLLLIVKTVRAVLFPKGAF